MQTILQNATMFDWVLLLLAVGGGLAWLSYSMTNKAEPSWLGNAKLACVLGIVILAIRFSDFEVMLVVAAGITFVCWLIDKTVFRATRNADGEKVKPKRPSLIEHGAGFFMVIFVVLVLRSFVFEPFRIPSESMVPTLQNGDFVVVSKFAYGVRLPITNKKVFEVGQPERGDVVVFRYPPQPEIDYIKRIVGLPGDTISMRNNRLTINGKVVDYVTEAEFSAYAVDSCGTLFNEILPTQTGTMQHGMLDDQRNCSASGGLARAAFRPMTVPEGQYWVMGDNRQHSADSRSWGFVPEDNLAGKATYIWFNWRVWNHTPQFSRIGTAL